MIVGIDEVGRGCWAGPLTAAAVVLPRALRGLKDSKKMTKKQRETLAHIIRRHALGIGIGWVDAASIDKYGLSWAQRTAMLIALRQIQAPYEEIVIDGSIVYIDDPRSKAVVNGDDLIPEVSAAGIIAKVARDNFMARVATLYPQYKFESHVGYGTAMHRTLLQQFGTCQLHRLSWRPVRQLTLPPT